MLIERHAAMAQEIIGIRTMSWNLHSLHMGTFFRLNLGEICRERIVSLLALICSSFITYNSRQMEWSGGQSDT